MRKLFLVKILFVTNLIVLSSNSIADDGASIIPVREINEVLLKGLDNIAEGRSVSDIVVRHLNVGEENFGVSVVQRDQVEVRDEILGISHPDLDEIYYIVAGTGTMMTGGDLSDRQSSVSALLGPIDRGMIEGGTLQYVEPGDIAIIPKGMPHGWLKIDTESISYIIFRADPNKVMNEVEG